jgi:hypothetical protein
VSSTAAGMSWQQAMVVVAKVVEADHCLLLSRELESITLPDETTRWFSAAAREAFAIFEDLYLLGNGACRQFVQLEHLHKAFAVEQIEGVLRNYHELFRKARVSSSSFHTSGLYIAVIFTAPGTLTLVITPPSRCFSKGFLNTSHSFSRSAAFAHFPLE